ncbi:MULTISPECIES: aldehyde dehydrogenase [unclassified Leptolyngbya]|uniref:aldehyde dehydrogenase n=1 Tax=unclassified Leptolyngbya TaxID=2650499 RepID=UPI0016866BCF|nr:MULTISPECIES: aldehyde dehydrogenase [unclassified Leptolyngbya]MBD1909702.1 aldehyde dehydrogenase [Leptolyngbya sp. FACHB-8]MBD2155968.1 aldehyde dehydrogenase [Leptolyngbya sp. FACHB-16]
MVQSVQQSFTDVIQRQRRFFETGTTRPLTFRLEQLQRLRQAILDGRDRIITALASDLGRPEFEAYAFEVGVLKELDYALKNLAKWAKPQRVPIPLEQRPGKAQIVSEPLGVVLIMGPWNYPIQLVLGPLVAAIAAGNCAVLKPSELAPASSRFVAELVKETFEPDFVTVVEGGVEVAQSLLEERFDHIFFTGGTAIGKVVMAAAAKHLTPVTLELGGKTPCIVDADVDLPTTARRILWGKFINAGQTCIAPDYLLVDRKLKPALLEQLQTTLQQAYGEDPSQSADFGRIVSDRHFARVSSLLNSGTIVAGGITDASQRYIAPTILDNVAPDSPVMQDEIFGPILPVLEYDDLGEAIAFINQRPKPLALYVFSRQAAVQQRVIQQTSSGGVCINDTIMHIGVSELPFGGVGDSGMGRYHGKAGFDTFSHAKSILTKPFWLDLDWRYPPYANKMGLLKRVIGG